MLGQKLIVGAVGGRHGKRRTRSICRLGDASSMGPPSRWGRRDARSGTLDEGCDGGWDWAG